MKEFTDKFEKEYDPKYTNEEYTVQKKPGFNAEKELNPKEALEFWRHKGYTQDELKPDYWVNKAKENAEFPEKKAELYKEGFPFHIFEDGEGK